jgi:hypothetical protein
MESPLDCSAACRNTLSRNADFSCSGKWDGDGDAWD